mmetsp:Transcript_28319/g.71042  ORF Transcript_28319/g.71042 Transcript_28319/m.71042 type:complete len:280 (-) Transcript_28319:359-1198(-)
MDDRCLGDPGSIFEKTFESSGSKIVELRCLVKPFQIQIDERFTGHAFACDSRQLVFCHFDDILFEKMTKRFFCQTRPGRESTFFLKLLSNVGWNLHCVIFSSAIHGMKQCFNSLVPRNRKVVVGYELELREAFGMNDDQVLSGTGQRDTHLVQGCDAAAKVHQIKTKDDNAIRFASLGSAECPDTDFVFQIHFAFETTERFFDVKIILLVPVLSYRHQIVHMDTDGAFLMLHRVCKEHDIFRSVLIDEIRKKAGVQPFGVEFALGRERIRAYVLDWPVR